MTKEFIPYEEALALKELGFDEPCFGYYTDRKLFTFQDENGEAWLHSDIQAPLYQQAFRWFREKYNLHKEIIWDHSEPIIWYYTISKMGDLEFENISSYPDKVFNIPEEAELECLKQLIKIVKEKK